MPKDVNLRLANLADLSATGQQTAVDTEGGFFAVARLTNAAITGTSPTFDFVIQVSIDGGANYFGVGAFPRLVGTHSSIVISRPVFIPKPASGQIVAKVRLQYTIGGTTPVCNDVTVYLEPMLSLAPYQVDVELAEGVAKLI